jgi:uncharacterized membrane protein SpoIIM required for sporulation
VGAYVRARREAWERLDALARRAGAGRLPLEDVEAIDRLYRRAAGDLAYVRSAFPGSDAEGYLAQVTARAHGALYRPERPGLRAAFRLLAVEAPQTFRRHLPAFALAVAFLAAGLAAGALAVLAEPGAAALLVPEGVRDAVAAKRLWTDDLLSAAPGLTSSLIAHNNVTAAALAFGLGLSGGLGTAWIMLANGLVLGAVMAHTAQHGMLPGLLGFVAAHGPAELLALLLSAQAGFVVASALVDPGEWPRGLALVARGREAVRLLAVVVPVLVLVALLEGAVSPGARFPVPAKAALGISLAAGILAFLSLAGGSPGEVSDAAGSSAPERAR